MPQGRPEGSVTGGAGNRPSQKGVRVTARKTTTSSEVKQRWEAKAYKKYLVRFRADDDAELIQFIEQNKKKRGTSDLFKTAIEKIKNEGF